MATATAIVTNIRDIMIFSTINISIMSPIIGNIGEIMHSITPRAISKLLLEQVRKEFEEKRKAYSYLPLLARKTVENGEMSAQKMDMESKLSDFNKSRKVQVEFTGLCDDGLAQRQTGKALSKNGNALEALEFFTLGLAYGNKDIFDKVGYETRIMETGDEDMVKVPELTKILVTVKQQEDIRSDDLREFFTGVDMVATGAAEVTGCQVKFLFE